MKNLPTSAAGKSFDTHLINFNRPIDCDRRVCVTDKYDRLLSFYQWIDIRNDGSLTRSLDTERGLQFFEPSIPMNRRCLWSGRYCRISRTPSSTPSLSSSGYRNADVIALIDAPSSGIS